MKKSVVSFVRQQLAVTGSTKHNGRGAYHCKVVGSSFATIKQRLDKKIPLWNFADLIDDIKRTDHSITILFKSQHFQDDFYRTLIVDSSTINLYGYYVVAFSGEQATTL